MSKKVLLADDSVTIQRVVQIILAEGDYDLQVADNGDAALTQALTERPDIVLADVHMPGKNGYELCAAVRQEPALAGVRVLLLSGSFEAFDEARAQQVGADGSIAKPFESQALLDRMEDLLTRPAVAEEAGSVDSTIETVVATGSTGPDMWADLDGPDDPVKAPDSADPYEDEATQAGEEVELEADDLWDEDPLADTAEEQGAELTELPVSGEGPAFDDQDESLSADRAGEEPGLAESQENAAEEEILFLDESDLLPEDDEVEAPLAEEKSFEFITDDSAVTEPQESSEAPAENVGSFIFEEVPAPGPLDDEDSGVEERAVDMESEGDDGGAEPSVDDVLLPEGQDIDKEEPGFEPVENVPQEAVMTESVPLSTEAVTEAARGLSEDQLAAIVEQVAGKVVERLATTVLERIAWEVVPDLAESLIREEISRITTAAE